MPDTDNTALAALHRQRGQLKRKITDFRTFLDKFDEENKPSASDLNQLQIRMDRFKPVLDQIEQIQSQILQQPGISLPEEDSYMSDFENLYFSILGDAQALLDSAAPPSSNFTRDFDGANSIGSHNHNPGLNGVRLPTISLPKFDGQYTKWLEFHDTFSSLIDSNESLSKIQRFHYLRASLEREPADIIKSLQISAANYDIAWNLLRDRYTNKKLLIQKHLGELFNLKQITRECSSQLREISDTVTKNLRSLNSLGQPTEHWDSIIVHLITTKLDRQTARDWEAHKISGDIATLPELQGFLSSRADMLDNLFMGNKAGDARTPKDKPTRINKTFFASSVTCYFCQGNHPIYSCEKFIQLPVPDRIRQVKELKLCTICLRISHTERNCQLRSKGCKICKQSHNSLLHIKGNNDRTSVPSSPPAELPAVSTQNKVALSCQVSANQGVLLATARAQLQDSAGQWHMCRLLLDSGSQVNFITTKMQTLLGLTKRNISMSIQGITQVVSPIKFQCSVNLKSCAKGFNATINCLVIDSICDSLPTLSVAHELLNLPENLQLADPSDNTQGQVDLLIGAQLFWSLILQGRINLGKNKPVLQNTVFGWILSGPLPEMKPGSISHSSPQCLFAKTLDIQQQLQQFWQVEECPSTRPLSLEEKQCEEHFLQTTKRDDDGRFVVAIPWKNSHDLLGESKSTALKRFTALERKLSSQQALGDSYKNFMGEYEALNHMTKVDNPDDASPHFYIPHHGVINNSSLTSKLRVVFDASCQTSTGVSSNDLQLVGPTLQSDLFSILVHFRQHPIAFSADIEKMYRQVLVKPEERRFQRILWRDEQSKSIATYELKTVTYGTAAAAYLATRCLLQIAEENSSKFPEAAEIIKRQFYVDDMLSGANSTEEGIRRCLEVSQILQQACFKLHKWVSNDPKLLDKLEVSNSNSAVCLGPNDVAKTLGLYWHPSTDALKYKITPSSCTTKITKRQILSEISQVFDPLGLLSPCIIVGKIMLQSLWQERLDWDDEVPDRLAQRWVIFQHEITILNGLQIPRYAFCKDPVLVQLHGFSDASEAAYCACIYVRCQDSEGNFQVHLLCSKSKVAPLKRLTVPRLELCGAHLLVTLMTTVSAALQLRIDQTFLWCDSTIVLGWIKQSPSILKVFVSHRVADIQVKGQGCEWRHVPSSDNPADLGSRGISPGHLHDSALWWRGPSWLSSTNTMWPNQSTEVPVQLLPEVKKMAEFSYVANKFNPLISISNFTSYNRLVRTIAFCFRFIKKCRKSPDCSEGPLTASELNDSLNYIAKTVQQECFSPEIGLLKNGNPVSGKSAIVALNPFLDENGVVRAGGRLSASSLEFEQRHPVILPKHHFTSLLFAHEHIRLLHAGPQLLLASIRDKFWPLNGKNYARSTVRKCLRCFRCKPSNAHPVMGNMPSDRVNKALPFQIVGVDYTGPLSMKDKQGRGAKLSKCYVALFVCLVTKAIHVELVTTLNTKSFLASLKRFIARRGRPTKIYSDNGLNFVGANNELRQAFKLFRSEANALTEELATEGISWMFIPPNSPHFGGLWEAGVKGLKFHLKRIVANAHLTYEQLNTLLVQIESVLNSRPITPMSVDPNDLEPLTPSHFLIGRKLTALPEEDISEVSSNRLSYFQYIQKLLQQFWTRWSKEYLQTLFQRTKWKQNSSNIKVGDMVLLKMEDTPPLCWPIGRISEVFPGKDNVVRVVSVKTKGGLYKRCVSKVYPLPCN